MINTLVFWPLVFYELTLSFIVGHIFLILDIPNSRMNAGYRDISLMGFVIF